MSKSFLSALFKKSRGFTLVELMVVVAIMMIMTAVVIVNYRPGNQQLALNRSASKLAQDIRRAQEMAMSSAECPPGTGCVNQVPPRYGVYIPPTDPVDPNDNFYILFADYPNDPSDGKFKWPPVSTEDTEIERIYCEKNILIRDASGVDCAPIGPKRAHITFMPPDPVTDLWIGRWPTPPDPEQCTEIVLTLQVGTSGPTKSVIINNAGLIYVE